MNDYRAAVEKLMRDENLERLHIEGKPYFSWRACECCNSLKGGDRYRALGYCAASGTEAEHRYDLCPGCAEQVMQDKK